MSGYNMAAANMYGLFPNIYNNQIALNDLTDLDLYSPTGLTIDPALSMNDSIFRAMPFGGTPFGGVPYMPTFGTGGNYEDYYKNYEKYQDFMIDSQVRQQEKWRGADLRLNSPQEGIQKQASYLHDKILSDEQEQIVQAYNNFKESVRLMYGDNATDEQIANRASTLYKQVIGKTIAEDIREHGRDSFTQGFLQTLTFGLCDGRTAEENIAELTGQPVGRKEKTKKTVGNITGGMVAGGTAALATVPILKALKFSAKSRTFWGLAIGATIGALTTIFGSKS